MEKPAQNIQDSFLNNARKEKMAITIYLLSGVKLSGRIRSFDKYCLVLETSNQEQLIFKHAISTVVMQRASVRDYAAREGVGERHIAPVAPGPQPAPAPSHPQTGVSEG
jgi:host factor-I protein